MACALLERVLVRGLSLDQALQETSREKRHAWPPPGGSDHAFAYAITCVTLRHLGEIDGLLDNLLRKPPPPKLMDILRIGTAQLLFLQTPAHAAVHVAVSQAGEHGTLRPLRSLVNGVLRNCVREGHQYLSGRGREQRNVPPALLVAWRESYGIEQTERIAAINSRQPPLDLQLRNTGHVKAWRDKLRAMPLPAGGLRVFGAGIVTEMAGFREGEWWVQDLAASLPVRLLARKLAGEEVLELCAAPGGKTAQLCASGAKVVSLDRSCSRLEVLRSNLNRLRLKPNAVIEADALDWRPPRPMHRVLLDAPCSASGTLRRNPDAAWRAGRSWEAGSAFRGRFSALQGRLLAAAGDMVAPGGVLVYSVCSLEREEGEERVAAFLQERPEFAREAVESDWIDGLEECITPAGDLRTLPCHLEDIGGMDGFYAARLIRRS